MSAEKNQESHRFVEKMSKKNLKTLINTLDGVKFMMLVFSLLIYRVNKIYETH
jgi:hypothetical protein